MALLTITIYRPSASRSKRVLMMILKDIGIASRGDASPNVSSRVISTQIPGIRSDTSISYLLLAEDDAEDDDTDTDTDADDDTLVSLVSFVVVLLLLLL